MDKILKLQTEIGVLSKTETNPFFKSKYMDINGLLAQLLPLLEKHGLTVTQPLTNVSGRPAISTCVFDNENDVMLEEDMITLPDIADPQKMGSCITYYRRYALQSLFLLQAQDDDGNHASEKSVQLGEKTPKGNTAVSKQSQEDYKNGDEPF